MLIMILELHEFSSKFKLKLKKVKNTILINHFFRCIKYQVKRACHCNLRDC